MFTGAGDAPARVSAWAQSFSSPGVLIQEKKESAPLILFFPAVGAEPLYAGLYLNAFAGYKRGPTPYLLA